ncbi:MAG: hypothetical protein AMXMBFR26_08550 [Porticoccaceae bacterium]
MGLGGISIWQLLIILVIVMLIFGTKRLKGLGGDIGGAIKGFRDAMNDDKGKKDEPERLDAQTDAQQRESSPADASGNHKNP